MRYVTSHIYFRSIKNLLNNRLKLLIISIKDGILSFLEVLKGVN
jgi:hypothetical protein